MSPDNTYLIAYINYNNNEAFYVFDCIKNEIIWDGILDLSARNREDPKKLLIFSSDGMSVIARGKNKKSVIIYSTVDGSVLVETNQLHTNYI